MFSISPVDHKAVVKLCKEYGCCDACSIRYIGVKSPSAYENPHAHVLKYTASASNGTTAAKTTASEPANGNQTSDEPSKDSESISLPAKREQNSSEALENEPSAKRQKSDICISCLGILQKPTWEQAANMVKEVIEKKKYSATTFAAGLSSPVCTIYREKVITTRLIAAVPHYDASVLTALKEAWKWTFGVYLESSLNMALDSGKYAPLLITVNIEYPDDLQELEVLKTLSPAHFATRAQQKRRFTVDFTRRSVSDALDDVDDSALAAQQLSCTSYASCVSVVACHEPVYLAGRYIKLSRWLPQTPWLVRGRRMVASSVQDAIFTPIARLYDMSVEDIEHRLKFMSAGREDVDVRCLGDGRPFVIEISDPRRCLTEDELSLACDEISRDKQVIVKRLVHVTRDDLVHLKKGEESKSKTYEALVVKLQAVNGEVPLQFAPSPVTEDDIRRINSFAPTTLLQRTPLRVLHRRPLLTRQRGIFELKAEMVESNSTLLKIRLKTEAGTYVKEFVHGECGRTRPCLADALKQNGSDTCQNVTDDSCQNRTDDTSQSNGVHCNGSANKSENVESLVRFDILALDVESIHLEWPIKR